MSYYLAQVTNGGAHGDLVMVEAETEEDAVALAGIVSDESVSVVTAIRELDAEEVEEWKASHPGLYAPVEEIPADEPVLDPAPEETPEAP